MARITTDQVRELLEQDKSGRITRELFQAFLRNPQGWAGEDGIVEIELELTYVDGIVVQLRNAGGPWGYCNEQINDENYPVKGQGTVKIRFKLVPGELFKRDDGYCYRSDFKEFCQARNWREANAAEALLPVARDKRLGRGEHPVVAFVAGSRAAFFVYGFDRERNLRRSIDDGPWRSHCLFLAVCE